MNTLPNYWTQPYFHTMGPLIVVTATAFVVMILEFMFQRGDRRWLTGVSMLGVLVALAVAISFAVGLAHKTVKIALALNTVALEPVGTGFTIVILIGTFLILLFSLDYTRRTKIAAEHTYLLLFAVVGALAMSTSFDLISLYVGLELLSVSSYVLVALKRKSAKSVEGGAKYLIMGSIGSAILLYGFSFIYGISGTTNILDVGQSAKDIWATYPSIVVLAFILVIAGLGVKLSLVPFHMWTPDVYEGAPSPIAGFLSTVSKVAGFVLLLRLSLYIFGVATFTLFWWIGVLAALTMVVGNLLALPQRNMKRLLAFSSIAQAGYAIVPYALFGKVNIAQDWYGLVDSVLFYLLAYTFMTIGAFAVVSIVGQQRGTGDADALTGLARRNPWVAAALTIFLLSLAGMPLTAGFLGKFYIVAETLHTHDLWLGVVLFGSSVISFFYYFTWIRKIYQRDAQPDCDVPAEPIRATPVMHTLLGLCVLGTLVLGIFPAAFMSTLGTLQWF